MQSVQFCESLDQLKIILKILSTLSQNLFILYQVWSRYVLCCQCIGVSIKNLKNENHKTNLKMK